MTADQLKMGVWRLWWMGPATVAVNALGLGEYPAWFVLFGPIAAAVWAATTTPDEITDP